MSTDYIYWPDCEDGSDEAQCEDWVCPNNMLKCSDNVRCVFSVQVCDGSPFDCTGNTDEDESVCDRWSCPQGTWKCHDNSRCIPEIQIFDIGYNCPDGSDESQLYQMNFTCLDGYLMCNGNNVPGYTSYMMVYMDKGSIPWWMSSGLFILASSVFFTFCCRWKINSATNKKMFTVLKLFKV